MAMSFPVTAGLFDGPKKLLFPSQQRTGLGVISRDVSSPAFVGKFGQKPMLRFPDNPNNGKPSTGRFVRPDMAEAGDDARSTVRMTASGDADFGMATHGDHANTKGMPVRSALEHASQLSNDVLWVDFDHAPPKQRRR